MTSIGGQQREMGRLALFVRGRGLGVHSRGRFGFLGEGSIVLTKAIETVYNGYRFRSRIEARWAVFFDHLGMLYEYEPEGYEVGGTWYLPDFWLPTLYCWLEVKAAKPTQEEVQKAQLLGEVTGHNVVIAWQNGGIGEAVMPLDWDQWHKAGDGYYLAWPFGDNFFQFCFCDSCGAIGLEYEGRSDRMKCKKNGCPKSWHGDKGRTAEHPRLVAAYTAARQARFEHGESPWTEQKEQRRPTIAVPG